MRGYGNGVGTKRNVSGRSPGPGSGGVGGRSTDNGSVRVNGDGNCGQGIRGTRKGWALRGDLPESNIRVKVSIVEFEKG